MSWADRFRWTSRSELCDQLLQFLFTAPPTASRELESWTSDQWHRVRAAGLLRDLEDESSGAGLIRLLLDPSEEREVRHQALFGITNRSEIPRLPLSDLKALFDDRLLWDDSAAHPGRRIEYWEQGVFIELLRLFRGAEEARLAQSFLCQWSAEDRSHLLRDLLIYVGEPDPALLDWLYRRWLTDDRFQIEGTRNDRDASALNLRVALAHSDRPESRILLRGFWLRASAEERPALLDELWCGLEGDIGCLATDPSERQELAEALALPLADLLGALGPERLLDRIEVSLRSAGRAIAAARWPHPPSWSEEPGRALQFLAGWPDASINPRIASLICCPDLHMVLRRELLDLMWKREPELALEILRRAIVEPALYPLAEWLLPWLCQRPRPEDKEFFRWALKQEAHPVVRYRSVEALERLGEDGATWPERLDGMARSPDPYLRVHALGALAGRGEESYLEKLEQIARRARHVCVRAEAIRVLGELDPARHLALLRRALLEDHATCGPCPCGLPAAQEAAIALSRLSTPEALTALAHGCLIVPDQDLPSWIGDWLRRVDGQQRGSSMARRNRCWGICRLDAVDRCCYRQWHDDEEGEDQ